MVFSSLLLVNVIKKISDAGLKRLEKCVASGLENPSSGLGCYAMSPSDYNDELSPFFDKVVAPCVCGVCVCECGSVCAWCVCVCVLCGVVCVCERVW